MGATFSQFFPPAPTLTEENLPSQKGRVFLITGGYSGVGLELSKLLYGAGGKIYVAGRSEDSARAAIEEIKGGVRDTEDSGELNFLFLDLSDLTTIKASALEFLEKEEILDVLFNNAGVSQPPVGRVSKQGHELQLATNCLGPFLFTSLLLPLLKRTAAKSDISGSSVRIIWTSSQVVDLSAPKDGLDIQELDTPPKDNFQNYVNSKTGNWFLASEFGKQVKDEEVLSIVQVRYFSSHSLLGFIPPYTLTSIEMYSIDTNSQAESGQSQNKLDEEQNVDDVLELPTSIPRQDGSIHSFMGRYK